MQGNGSDAFKTTGRCFSVAAGRIAFTYALKGKSQIGTYVAAYLCHTLSSHQPCVHSLVLPKLNYSNRPSNTQLVKSSAGAWQCTPYEGQSNMQRLTAQGRRW